MMFGKAMRGIGTMVLCWLAAFVVVVVSTSPSAKALNFAVYSLVELAAGADHAFVGTVTAQEDGDEDWFDWYALRIDIPLHGGLAKDHEVRVRVAQFADEGVLDKGDTYLILLDDYGADGYTISGVHQGFIKLKNGRAESRFYEQEEIDRYLERYGLKVKTIYERLLPAEEVPVPVSGHGRGTETAIAWVAGIALAGMLVGLYYRSRRTKNRAK
jgi:hypothetical protein